MVLAWKAKKLLNKSIEPPATSHNSLNARL